MEIDSGTLNSHKISLTSRKRALLLGIKDVRSFDSGEVILETTQGILTIKGQELHINRLLLERGEVDVDGKVDSMIYSEDNSLSKKTGSIIERLFK